MKQTLTKDLTVGSPLKLMIGFITPLLLGLVFQQLYNMVDTAIVGKTLGVNALAGVGSTGSINFLVMGLCIGTCEGFTIPAAQKFGQRDYTGLRRTVGNILLLAGIIAVVMTAATTGLCRRILTWMNTPTETFGHAYNYIFIIFLGIPASILYNTLASIIRSVGDSRTPLLFLILSSVLNVVLDLLLILVFRMGVAGAAVATVLAQLVSGILCLLFMFRQFPMLRLTREDLRLRWSECRRLLRMGLPMGLQYSITAIGSIVLQKAINGLGPGYMAAVTAGDKFLDLLFVPINAIGSAIATFAGQNVGAGKLHRIHGGTRACGILGGCYALAVFLAVYLWGDIGLQLFLKSDQSQVIQLSYQYLLGMAACLGALLCVNLFRFAIQGMGFSASAMIAGVLELVARAGLGLWLVPRFGFTAVCFANPAAWLMADLFLIPMYFYAMRRLGYRKSKDCAPAEPVV